MSVEQEKVSEFDRFLTDAIDEAEVAIRREQLADAAFTAHLKHIGGASRDDNYKLGTTSVSLDSYFRHTVPESNRVNTLALSLPPTFTHKSGYGDTTDTTEHWNTLYAIEQTRRAGSALAAERIGQGVEWAVGSALNFKLTDYGTIGWKAAAVAKELPRDLNESFSDELPVVAERVKRKGYQDFLDYLLDAQQILEGRVDTLFDQGPQNPGRLF